MLNVISSLLAADGIISGLLPGGVYDHDTVREISRQLTPAAFDSSGALLACMLVSADSDTPGLEFLTSNVMSVTLYLYDARSYAPLRQAAERAFDLLHDATPILPAAYPGADNDIMFRIRYAGSVPYAFDDTLGARLVTASYAVYYAKRAVCNPPAAVSA